MRFLLLFLPLFLLATPILNDIKQKEFSYDEKFAIEDSKDTEKSWINPIMLQYNYSKDNSLESVKTTNELLSVSVNQPVFKSGAIYYSIKYAKHLKNYNLLNIKMQRRNLIKEALDLAYQYRIALLNKKILDLEIKNSMIDIEKKKEEFLNGVGDSTLLDNAILKLNSQKLSLVDLDQTLSDLRYSFANISSLDIKTIQLPVFKLISKKRFLNENLSYLSQMLQKKVKYDLYKMQKGNQLLSVSLNASYNHQKIRYSPSSMMFQNNTTDFYKIGFSVNLPISANASNKIEKAKIDYLKSALLIKDKRDSLIRNYESIIKKIKFIEKKIAIYNENKKIYDNLIASTKDSLKAGNVTTLDLQILQNSKKTIDYQIEILKLQKQRLLLELYYQTQIKL